MKQGIHAESYIQKTSEIIPVDSLPEAERAALATWLKTTCLAELYRGKADVALKQIERDPAK